MKKIIFFFSILSFQVLGQSLILSPGNPISTGLKLNGNMVLDKKTIVPTFGDFIAFDRKKASIIYFAGGGFLHGIADGEEGSIVYVINSYPSNDSNGGGLLEIKNESSQELSSRNRILTPGRKDIQIGNSRGGVLLFYDGVLGRWRVLGSEFDSNNPSDWSIKGNVNLTDNFLNRNLSKLGFQSNEILKIKTNGTEKMRIDIINKSIAIGKQNANAMIDVNGDIALSKKTIITRTGIINDLNLDESSHIFLNGNGNVVLNGIKYINDRSPNLAHIYTGPNTSLTINNNSILQDGNRPIYTPSVEPLYLPPNSGFILYKGPFNSIISYAKNDGNNGTPWNITGNNISNADFIGTTTNSSLKFISNNITNLSINPNGSISGKGYSFLNPVGSIAQFNNYVSINSPNSTKTGIVFGRPEFLLNSGGVFYNENNVFQIATKADNAQLNIKGSNTGIGTNDPKSTLDIQGDIRLQKMDQSSSSTDFLIENKSLVSCNLSNQNYNQIVDNFAGVGNSYKAGQLLYISFGPNTSLVRLNTSTNNADQTLKLCPQGTCQNLSFTGRGGAILIYDGAVWRLLSYY